MTSLQKMGGFSALAAGATFVFGMVALVSFLMPNSYGSLDIEPAQNVAFLVENQVFLYWWYLIIYQVFGFFLVVMTLALHERLSSGSSALSQIATVFGLIWAVLMFASGMVANIGAEQIVELYVRDQARAESVWLALRFVVNGLGGGNEIVGGIWVLLISCAALQSAKLPRALNYLGLVAGAAGVVTVVPGLGMLGAIFGLGTILWFFCLGIVFLRQLSAGTSFLPRVNKLET